MKINLPKLFLVLFLLLCITFSQGADLVLQNEITPNYITYLLGKEADWWYQVNFVGGDTPETMQAHMGLAILQFAWSHVDGDTMVTDLEPILEEIGQNLNNIGDRIENNIVPILDALPNQDQFFNNLIDFFNSGDYVNFRDSLKTYLDNIEIELDNVGLTIDDFLNDVDYNSSREQFADHLDTVIDGTADFDFSIQVLGSAYEDTLFIFSRTFFDRIGTLETIGETMGDNFDEGGSWIDSVMAITGADVMPGISSFRTGLTDLTELLDSLKVILVNQPFTPFEIDVSPLDSIQSMITEVDTLLGGKEYSFGPEAENKTIKPLAIIQNMPGEGLINIYKDFYRTNDPDNYTFGGIFPTGLDSRSIELLTADAVINNWDDMETFDDRLMFLKTVAELAIMIDPDDPDAHLGVALVLFYEMIRDHSETYADAFRLLDEGRIDSLTFYYDWDSFDVSDELREIDDHAAFYVNSEEPTHFILLIKTEPDSYGPYEIGANSQFELVHISVFTVALIRESLHLAGAGLGLIADGLTAIFDEVSEIFVVDLDPTVLDFSQVDSDTDLVLLLEQSNPDFLTVTPYGIEQFHRAGEWIEDGFFELGTFFDHMTDLANAMAPYEEDFDMDGAQFIADMEMAQDISWELWTDFAYPDSTIIVNDERVNFSAWFDNPPSSFLIMWKNYIFGIDSTLGGLFPDRPSVSTEIYTSSILPKKFVLYPNYPNPFNPTTHIAFDIPKGGEISLVIFNIRGEEVTRLVDEYVGPGRKVLNWDARELSSGIYICRFEYNGKHLTNKMMLLK